MADLSIVGFGKCGEWDVEIHEYSEDQLLLSIVITNPFLYITYDVDEKILSDFIKFLCSYQDNFAEFEKIKFCNSYLHFGLEDGRLRIQIRNKKRGELLEIKISEKSKKELITALNEAYSSMMC